MSKSSESNIDRLRKRLNSQNQPSSERNESRLSATDTSGIRKRWQHDDPPPGNNEPPKEGNSGGSFLNKLLIFSAVFFILAFGFAAFNIWTGSSTISPDKVNIEIAGPKAVSAGDTVDFGISITNQNKVPLQEAQLVVAYPEGTRDPANTGMELRRTRQEVGSIPAGRTIQENLSASLFGEQGDTRTLSVQLEYRVEGSNAIFSADSTNDVEITEAPISLETSIPGEVTTGEPFTMEVNVSSNVSRSLSDVLLVARYPFGFSVHEVDPEADYRQHVWQLGDITPGSDRSISITGAFTDSNATDEQAFRFDVGTARAGDATEVGTLFASQDETIMLEEPFINVDLELDTQQQDAGNRVRVMGEVNWQSNLNTDVRGGEITIELSGEGIDYNSVDSDNGLYRFNTRSLIWNTRTNDELQTISPGDTGSLQFEFMTNSSRALVDVTENPQVDIDLRMQAQAPDSSTLPNPVTASLSQVVRLPSVVGLTADTLYEDGPFENTGPTPPEADEKTSYTLHLSVANTTNEITNAKLSAAVPAYVEIAGEAEPASSEFSYNDISGRIQWNIGTIPAGAGYTQAPKEIFIPVIITPTQNHVGQTLPLLQDISISGTDSFREKTIQVNNSKPPTTVLDDLRTGQSSGQVED